MKRIQGIFLIAMGVILLAANADAGRWITRDPIEHMERDPKPTYQQQINLYQFVGNNPANRIDPLGLWWWDAGYIQLGVPQLAHEFFIGKDPQSFPAPDPNSYGAQRGVENNFNGQTASQVVTDIGMAVPEGVLTAAMMLGGEGEAEGAYQAADKVLKAAKAAKKCPKFTFNFKTAKPDEIYRRLKQYHGIDPALASERLHAIKAANGFGAADNVVLDLTGNVYNPATGDWIGSLTAGGAKVR